MILDLTRLARRRFNDGVDIDHYYRLFKEEDGELTLYIRLRQDQSINRKWLRKMAGSIDIKVLPYYHRDNNFITHVKKELVI